MVSPNTKGHSIIDSSRLKSGGTGFSSERRKDSLIQSLNKNMNKKAESRILLPKNSLTFSASSKVIKNEGVHNRGSNLLRRKSQSKN